MQVSRPQDAHFADTWMEKDLLMMAMPEWVRDGVIKVRAYLHTRSDRIGATTSHYVIG